MQCSWLEQVLLSDGTTSLGSVTLIRAIAEMGMSKQRRRLEQSTDEPRSRKYSSSARRTTWTAGRHVAGLLELTGSVCSIVSRRRSGMCVKTSNNCGKVGGTDLWSLFIMDRTVSLVQDLSNGGTEVFQSKRQSASSRRASWAAPPDRKSGCKICGHSPRVKDGQEVDICNTRNSGALDILRLRKRSSNLKEDGGSLQVTVNSRTRLISCKTGSTTVKLEARFELGPGRRKSTRSIALFERSKTSFIQASDLWKKVRDHRTGGSNATERKWRQTWLMAMVGLYGS